MNGIYQDYYDFIRVAFLLQMRPWNCHRKSDSAYTHASLGGGHHAIPLNACFNEHWYMNGIWMVYERHIISGGLLLVGGTLPGLPGLPSAPGRFGPGTSANLFGFDHRKSTNTRLGPAKVPQPGVVMKPMMIHDEGITPSPGCWKNCCFSIMTSRDGAQSWFCKAQAE